MVPSGNINERVEELKEETSLSNREAEVRARKERGYTHEQIAEELGIEKSTVDEYSRRIGERREDALSTIQEVPVEDIKVRCLECGSDVEEGPMLADFPICEPCFRKLWRGWFEEEVSVNLERETIDGMLDKRVKILDRFNQALVKQHAKSMSNS